MFSNKSIKYFDLDTATCIANLCKLTLVEKEKIDFQSEDENHKNNGKTIALYKKKINLILKTELKIILKMLTICIKSKLQIHELM